jgi:hypothetical protein
MQAGLSLLSPLENETLFNITLGTSEVIGIYSSPLGATATDKLILYIFNDDTIPENSGKYHTYKFDIRLMNANRTLLGKVIMNTDNTFDKFTNLTNNQVRVMTNAFASLNPRDPNTRTLANGLTPSGVLKYSFDISDLDEQITDCSNHQVGGANLNPAVILNITDTIISGDNLELESGYVSKMIIIGTGISTDLIKENYIGRKLDIGTLTVSDAAYYEGVVNACYIQ